MRAKTINEAIKHLPGRKLSKKKQEEYRKEERLKLYYEAANKIDKFMPDDFDLQNEYYEILDSAELPHGDKVSQLEEFIEMNVIDGERMYSYFPEDGNIREFAECLIMRNEQND